MSITADHTIRYQTFRIVAQDPAVKVNGKILTAKVSVPVEDLAAGPWGYRVHVIDYDATSQKLYRPLNYKSAKNGQIRDPYAEADDETLLNDPRFHAQNVYAIVMRTLARFEFALGRRIKWGFKEHQLNIAPHAFADANAFYSEADKALMFGYFPGANGKPVLSCLSHDVVAHETTHALVDGLRDRYTDPSSPDQAGFHEGFADVVALLSVFAIPDVVRTILDLKWRQSKGNERHTKANNTLIGVQALDVDALRDSILFGLADQMGEEMSMVRGQALRASAKLHPPIPDWYQKSDEFMEPHRRGEILVAAIMNAFLEIWSARLLALDPMKTGKMDRGRVAEEGAQIAERLLTMSIRALDYCPPVHLEYGDFISALLTGDYELNPDDSRYNFRRTLHASFIAYGIQPASKGTQSEAGIWKAAEAENSKETLDYNHTHLESIQHDPDEVFKFIWENREALDLYEGAYTQVQSVRPCHRIAVDGFVQHETVAEYVQILRLTAREITEIMGITVPKEAPQDHGEIFLYGGGVLIFDEYGRVKYHIHNRINNKRRQSKRLQSLAEFGYFTKGANSLRKFSNLHRMRALNTQSYRQEGWY